MIKNYFHFVCLFCFVISVNIYAQKTYIPDDNFEQRLIDLNIDKDGIVNDSVATADISGLTSLDIKYQNISDLTGVEDFMSLQMLFCHNNELTSINLSKNTALIDIVKLNITPLSSSPLFHMPKNYTRRIPAEE